MNPAADPKRYQVELLPDGQWYGIRDKESGKLVSEDGVERRWGLRVTARAYAAELHYADKFGIDVWAAGGAPGVSEA